MLNLGVPLGITITPAPNGADLRYGTTPSGATSATTNLIDEDIAAAIAATPTPANLPGTPLTRLQTTRHAGDPVPDRLS